MDNHKLPTSIQCQAIVDPPVKRHLKFRWWPALFTGFSEKRFQNFGPGPPWICARNWDFLASNVQLYGDLKKAK